MGSERAVSYESEAGHVCAVRLDGCPKSKSEQEQEKQQWWKKYRSLTCR